MALQSCDRPLLPSARAAHTIAFPLLWLLFCSPQRFIFAGDVVICIHCCEAARWAGKPWNGTIGWYWGRLGTVRFQTLEYIWIVSARMRHWVPDLNSQSMCAFFAVLGRAIAVSRNLADLKDLMEGYNLVLILLHRGSKLWRVWTFLACLPLTIARCVGAGRCVTPLVVPHLVWRAPKCYPVSALVALWPHVYSNRKLTYPPANPEQSGRGLAGNAAQLLSGPSVHSPLFFVLFLSFEWRARTEDRERPGRKRKSSRCALAASGVHAFRVENKKVAAALAVRLRKEALGWSWERDWEAVPWFLVSVEVHDGTASFPFRGRSGWVSVARVLGIFRFFDRWTFLVFLLRISND